LLLLSVGIIIWTLYYSYNIFTAKTKVPEIFEMIQQKPTASPGQTSKNPQEQVQQMLQQGIQEQMKEMIPSNVIPKLLNLVCWSMFAAIASFGGAQIGSLGIKLLKQ